MLKLTLRKLLAALMLSALSSSLFAQQKTGAMDDVIRTLFSAHDFQQTAIAPNGKQVAWMEKLTDKNGVPSGNSAIYVSDISGTSPRRITAGNGTDAHAEGPIAWSPDSTRLAFLSDAGKPGKQQLYVA